MSKLVENLQIQTRVFEFVEIDTNTRYCGTREVVRNFGSGNVVEDSELLLTATHV